MSLRKTSLWILTLRAFFWRTIGSAAFLVALGTGVPSAWALAPPDACLVAISIVEGVRHFDQDALLPGVYRLEVPQRGAVALDVQTPLTKPRQLRLKLLATGCTDSVERLNIVRQVPGSLLLWAPSPGAIYVVVEAEQGVTNPGHFALHAAFAAEPTTYSTVVTLEEDPPAMCGGGDHPTIDLGKELYALVRRPPRAAGNVEPEDCDVLEVAFKGPGVAVLSAEGGPFDAALFAGEDCGTPLAMGQIGTGAEDLVIPVFAGVHRSALGLREGESLAYSLAIKHLPLCLADDASRGLLRCAAVLDFDSPLVGELENGLEHAFTFVIDKQTQISITGQGESLEIALFDHPGLRLALGETCDGSICQMDITLPAGRYGLRVAATGGGAAPYVLTLTSRDTE